jgi:ATPase involved in DNA repair
MKNETEELIDVVRKLKEDKVFEKYIDNIYFPYYKNFEEFSKITFDFPLTVIVGKNGSGKSSILHALYGCPKGKNPANFWFSTATDPIIDGNGKNNRHCFVYSFYDNDQYKQVAYTRASRPGTETKKKMPIIGRPANH